VDVLKNLFVASKIGVSDLSDVYLSLIIIPDSLMVLIGFDTIKGVVNSEFSSLDIKKDINKIHDSFKTIFTYIFITSTVVVAIMLLFRVEIISNLLPGFDAEKRNLAVDLSLFVFPVFLCKALIALFHSHLNSLKKYYYPVIPQIMVTLCILFFVMMPYFKNIIIYNLGIGLLVGNLFYTFILFIPIVKEMKFNLINFKINELSRKIFLSCISLLFFVVINQTYLFSRNFIVSYFPDGSLAALNYASSITTFISALSFSSIFGVLLSNLADNLSVNADKKTIEESSKSFYNTMLSLFYIYIPIVISFVLFHNDILSLLYLRGKFDAEGIKLTSLPFIWESFALLPFVFYIVPTALFLATKQYKKLTIIGVSVYLLGIILNISFSYIFGYYGISISSFVTSLIYAIFLMKGSQVLLRKPHFFTKDFLLISLSGIITFLFSYLAGYFLSIELSDDFVKLVLILIAKVTFVFIVFIFISHTLKVNLAMKVKQIFISGVK
jgi:putative peptidoglycan lipid II flippase